MLYLAFPLAAAAAASLFSATPINDMGQQTYLGFSGGLYPGGDRIPADHAAAGLSQAALVKPLDVTGAPIAGGKVALLSVGMSNTTQEFCAQGNPAPCDSWSFAGQAAADPAVNHTTLSIVNGARGGQDASTWLTASAANYDLVRNNDLQPAGLSEAQVQAAWVKEADAGPTRSLPDSNADAYVLETRLGMIVRAMKTRYPNLRLVYLSSRIYAGYATSALNPEPYAYESGFAVKWLIEAQINQRRTGVVDPRAGDLSDAVAPWIGWGPYLWASGATARSDGLTWMSSEFQSDGTHPSMTGQQKVGRMLLSFLKNEPTARAWFMETAAACQADAATLCLNAAHSFAVTLSARDSRTGRTAAGMAIPQNDLFGYFSIPALTGNAGNPEVFVKILDGTSINGKYWVFYGVLTDLEITISVIETATGRAQTYTKAAGSACGGWDTSAF